MAVGSTPSGPTSNRRWGVTSSFLMVNLPVTSSSGLRRGCDRKRCAAGAQGRAVGDAICSLSLGIDPVEHKRKVVAFARDAMAPDFQQLLDDARAVGSTQMRPQDGRVGDVLPDRLRRQVDAAMHDARRGPGERECGGVRSDGGQRAGVAGVEGLQEVRGLSARRRARGQHAVERAEGTQAFLRIEADQVAAMDAGNLAHTWIRQISGQTFPVPGKKDRVRLRTPAG
jgi:hypothetical protein